MNRAPADNMSSFYAAITKPSSATQWLNSDHVTSTLEKFRKERLENHECACGNCIPEAIAHAYLIGDEYVCGDCR